MGASRKLKRSAGSSRKSNKRYIASFRTSAFHENMITQTPRVVRGCWRVWKVVRDCREMIMDVRQEGQEISEVTRLI